jgi:hypothetical protein
MKSLSLVQNLLNHRPMPCLDGLRWLYKSSGCCMNLIIEEIDKLFCIEQSISNKGLSIESNLIEVVWYVYNITMLEIFER